MKWYLLFVSIVLSACSNLPVAIKNPPVPDISYGNALQNSETYKNYSVRWGGSIIHVDNEESKSQIQILYYPLDRFGRAQTDRLSEGRFILESEEFLDPAIYREDMRITAAGTLTGNRTITIGNKSLSVPVVAVKTLYIWQDRSRNEYRADFGYGYGYGHPWGFYPYGYYLYPRFYYPWY